MTSQQKAQIQARLAAVAAERVATDRGVVHISGASGSASLVPGRRIEIDGFGPATVVETTARPTVSTRSADRHKDKEAHRAKMREHMRKKRAK